MISTKYSGTIQDSKLISVVNAVSLLVFSYCCASDFVLLTTIPSYLRRIMGVEP